MQVRTSILVVVVIMIFFGCNNTNEQINKSEELAALRIKKDSLKRIENEKQLDLEILSLKEQGIFGKWECKFSGYESIISFRQDNDNYFSIINFTKRKSKAKNETLHKKGNKYYVVDSKAKEYYVINSDGNLEIWDKDGLFTTAINRMPKIKEKAISKFNIDNVIGKNIYTVIGNYSKSSPETLDGTNNEYWIVYYSDIKITFKVLKANNIIRNAMKGKVENMK